MIKGTISHLPQKWKLSCDIYSMEEAYVFLLLLACQFTTLGWLLLLILLSFQVSSCSIHWSIGIYLSRRKGYNFILGCCLIQPNFNIIALFSRVLVNAFEVKIKCESKFWRRMETLPKWGFPFNFIYTIILKLLRVYLQVMLGISNFWS